MNIGDAIKKAVEGQNLDRAEAEAVLDQIMTGGCTEAQIAALLTALRMKGESIDEVAGFASVMRRRAAAVTPRFGAEEALDGTGREALIDTCGTGGDASGTFNVSTATAFVVAGCGVRVAKHGNRSVSSQCGSADVMEALGVRIELTPARIGECIDRVGIGFLHAPLLHQAMSHVAPVRRQLGIRTIFNLLGPLSNPAGANSQVIGVYAAHLTELAARVLRELGTRRALVVHGSDGLDEITISGPTLVTEVNRGEIKSYSVTPEEFGLTRAPLTEIQGGDAARNASIIRDVLEGKPGPCRDIVLLNACAALVASDTAQSLSQGVQLASRSIANGSALEKLHRLIEFTNTQ